MIRRILIRFLAVMLALGSCAAAGADGQGFKADYEALNGQPVPGHTDLYYLTLSLDGTPRAIQLSAGEGAALEEDGAVLFMGAPWCPWCRNALPSLLPALTEAGYDHFYYIDLTDERDTFIISGGRPVMTNEGTPGYRALLTELEEYLPDYTVPAADGTPAATGEKRIYLPTLAYLRGDRFVSALQPMCPPEEGQTAYDPLTEEQRAWLTDLIARWLLDSAGDEALPSAA